MSDTNPHLVPTNFALCIHDALAQSAAAHFKAFHDFGGSGGIYEDLYTSGSGTAVVVRTICHGEYGDKEPCDDETVERGALRPLEECECVAGCPRAEDCVALGIQPSDLVCGGFMDWLSERVAIEPACP